MLRIGITGQTGFVGSHLAASLSLHREQFVIINFKDEYFDETRLLEDFVRNSDVIVHFAAINRHEDPDVLYKTNVNLVQKLIDACEKTSSKPHILFSSSVQENRDNHYGRSKKAGRRLFEQWAHKHDAGFTGMLIPNVYGPFGKPFYNSVVATFCHQLTHSEVPEVDVDGEVGLIYIGELVSAIMSEIEGGSKSESPPKMISTKEIQPTSVIRVSSLLERLTQYRDLYFRKGVIPNLSDPFDLNLFNTFICYIDHSRFYPFHLSSHSDKRGAFVETMKLNSGGQISYSSTVPGVTRGNHYHTRKAERFAVIKGQARIQIRKVGTEKIFTFELNGENPSFVDMPIWYTHNITNIGNEDLFTIFWINEHYDEADPYTYFEMV